MTKQDEPLPDIEAVPNSDRVSNNSLTCGYSFTTTGVKQLSNLECNSSSKVLTGESFFNLSDANKTLVGTEQSGVATK